MKYKYPGLKGKCTTCIGCNRLELENFEGYYRCENYVKGDKNVRQDKNNSRQLH